MTEGQAVGYPPKLKELIRAVEQTRPERLARVRANRHFPRLPREEGEKILKSYHPDYRPGGRRRLKVGANKGEIMANEVADLLESYSHVDPDAFDDRLKKPDYETDVLILGGGGAGAVAALFARQNGLRVIIATKLRHGDSNTIMAEGGIQAADRPVDSPYYHYLDTIGGGHFTNNPRLVKALTMDAPLVIQWLEGLGVMFDKDNAGNMIELKGGGICRRRMHSSADMIGAEIMRVQRDEIRNHPNEIQVLEFSPAVELLIDETKAVSGAVLYNLETREYGVVKARAVIMATGGFGRLHIQGFPTTNHYGATGDGLALAYRVGVPLVNMRYAQYHPTGTVFPEQNFGLLITEKVRTLGAQFINAHGREFAHPLEPRDLASSCIIRECTERDGRILTPTGRYGVWLDTPMIDLLRGKGTVEKELSAKYLQFKRYGIDISTEPIIVYPTLHYQNGGLEIDEWGATGISGLFAAGEVTGGIHGDNRLMGNSLLDIHVFGRRVGIKVGEFIKAGKNGRQLSLGHVRSYHAGLKEAGVKTKRVAPILLPDYVRRSAPVYPRKS
ncbi:MAG: FAD-binding protein [Thermodesulfobacteriota bacterium]